MSPCHAPITAIEDTCIRSFWSSLVPLVLVGLYVLIFLPYPDFARRASSTLKWPFESFITLEEAEALNESTTEHNDPALIASNTKAWRSIFISTVSLLEVVLWLGFACYSVVVFNNRGHDIWVTLYPFFIATSWLYAAVRPVVRPITTIPFDLFGLFFLHSAFSIVDMGAILYSHYTLGVPPPHPTLLTLLIVKLVASLVILLTVLGTPFALPSKFVDTSKIGGLVSPEDYTTLWRWISFKWVEPMVNKGTVETLNEDDVYDLSPTIQSKPAFLKFSTLGGTTLLRKLLLANRLDLFIDFSLTIVSVIFNYAAPFFLKQILSAIDTKSPEAQSKAYVYAALSFVCLLSKSQADIQHLWFGRRAATRTRLELMAAIYDKALKRRDLSGTVAASVKPATVGEPDATKKGKKGSKGKAEEKSKPQEAGADVGKIVNLMSGDANRIAAFVSSGYFIYGAPFEIAIACTFLYQLMGWAAFVGFFVLVIASPANHYLSKRGVKIGKGLLAARDARMGVLNELIGAIKFIKFFAWEERWVNRVEESRAKELKWLVKERKNSVMFGLMWTVAPVLVSVVSFFTYTVIQGKELTVPIAFTAIALFNMLKLPLNVIPMFIVQGLQAGVALKRIEGFLNEEEVSVEVSSLKRPVKPDSDDWRVGAQNATFRWNVTKDTSKVILKDSPDSPPESQGGDTENKFELRDISVVFPPGQFSIITGPTAAGKSALLLAILGEMTLLPGGVIYLPKNPEQVDEYGLTNSISYCAQTPWLEHQSIRNNIIFSSPLDEARYDQVLECCALKPDLAILEDGDLTEIGARGLNLSGGQKARVALARAVYARTKHVLLDDIFAAVDSHTAHSLFENLFRGPLMAHRTVILVTHHLDLVLEGADYLVRLLDGRIDFQGSTKESQTQALLDILVNDTTDVKVAEEAAVPIADADRIASEDAGAHVDKKSGPKKARQLVKDEARATGSVKWSVYKTYLKACSYWTWAVIFFLVAIFQFNTVAEKFWVGIWGNAYKNSETFASHVQSSFAAGLGLEIPNNHILVDISSQHFTSIFRDSMLLGSKSDPAVAALPPANTHPMFYVGIYAAIVLGASVMSTANTIVQYIGALNASKRLFSSLLLNVVGARMRWFDTTPQGRILNRFSGDVEKIDSSLSGSIRATTAWVAAFIAAILTVAFFLPLFLFPAVFIGYFYYKLSLGYVNTGRDLRRMESNTKSPIFSAFGELIEGIVTVRAFSAETKFFNVFHTKVNTTSKMWYGFWMLNRHLLLHFDALGAISIFLTTLFALSSVASSAKAGLTITSAMSFTSSVYWTCRYITELEMDTNAVERVVEYLDLPQEAPAAIESTQPPAYWPSNTSATADSQFVVVEDLVIKYSPELDAVIKGVSFSLKARERVGLIGRTGSGKSTLAMALLRFVDPTSGRIIIDGIDITTIGLRDLRSKLTIIPQEAVLFSGTIRDNLDPFGDHSDDEVLDALFRVHLISLSQYTSRRSSRASTRAPSIDESVADPDSPSTPTTIHDDSDQKTVITLDSKVSAGGANFSQGQRQLIAMARALLRQSSIIIMDEATSSIDFATDAKIQRTIRDEFQNSLLITVAHRLRTVIDYDRLIVLDKGEVVEFGTPSSLIQTEGGIFREMCLKSGTFEELQAAAGGIS